MVNSMLPPKRDKKPPHTPITLLTMRSLFILTAALFTTTAIHAAPLEPVLLWPGGAPGALGDKDEDKPTLTAFLPAPEKATGAAIVICPGGGYGGLAPHEGAGYAEWLAQNGVAGIVLKYRLGSKGYRHPIELGDAAERCRQVHEPVYRRVGSLQLRGADRAGD